MIQEGDDQEYIRKLDQLALQQAQTGKGMAIGDRMLKYEHRWVSKLTESGSNTNIKGKRKGIFWKSNKGDK
eukprot:489658-Karenia_brevis.AAC.1